MTAPTRKAWFGDAIGGLDEVDDPKREAEYIIHDFASTAAYFPDWLAEEVGVEVRLTVLERSKGRSVIGWSGGGAEGTITFTLDPSGWILAVGTLGAVEMFRGYIDHAYEQYDVFPPGATPEPQAEAPGTIGKKRHWVSLRRDAWPALASLGLEQGINFTIDESKLKAT